MRKPAQRIEIFLPTDDNWYGNYENNTVRLKLSCDLRDMQGNKYHMVSVWGNDDIGMDMVFKGPDGKTNARAWYKKLLKMPKLNQKELLAMGFSWF